ncbi:MAG: lactate racemase domain-containing protein [bacterium]
MDVSLRYGQGTTVLHVPSRNVGGVFRPTAAADAAAPTLVGSPALETIRRAAWGKRTLVLVTDGTRAQAPAELARPLLAALKEARSIQVAIATGSHQPHTEANRNISHAMRAALIAAGAPAPSVLANDCHTDPFVSYGTTSRGTPILLSQVLESVDVFVVIADIKPHYFAGYSNPIKFFLPGMAAFEAIEANHRLALEPESTYGRHPFHPDPSRRSNPLAEDMAEAFAKVVGKRPAFALVTVTSGRRIVHAEAGDLRAVTARAFAVADEVASFAVPPTSHLVVSAGGAPQDATLYLAQRAIELTKACARDGAEILLLAECADGIADGPEALANFYDELARPIPEVIQRIRAGYRLYQHKAYKFAELIARIEGLHLTSRLTDDAVRAIHLIPERDPQALVDGWIRSDPDARIAFFDEANRLCVRAA